MAPNVREWCEQITILKWFVSRFSSQRQCFNRCFNYNYIFFYRTFDRSSALLERQRSKALRKWKISAGKILWWSLYRNTISNGLWSIWERKLYQGIRLQRWRRKDLPISQPLGLSDWIDHHVCLYARVQFIFPSIFTGGGGGETPHFAKIGIYYHTW